MKIQQIDPEQINDGDLENTNDIVINHSDNLVKAEGMNNNNSPKLGKWQKRSFFVFSGFRILAFIIGITLVYLKTPDTINLLSPHLILVIAGTYVLLSNLTAVHWRLNGINFFIMLGLDLCLSIFLLIISGGIHSPFLLFSLTPVLMAALYLDIKFSVIITITSAIYVIAIYLFHPFSTVIQSENAISFVFIYIMTIGLINALPYLINVNVRQQLKYNNILQERRRLSREIHDGAVQTISALRWQVQLFQRNLIKNNIHNDDINELEKLAERAQQETRECLELLRNFTGDGSFLPHLRDYVEHLKHETNINIYMHAPNINLRLAPLIELELLRICQEALTNVRRHAEANNVMINVHSLSDCISVIIIDDGRGFDVLSPDHNNNGQGMAVMAERARSVGGKFNVQSILGHGTEIHVEMPINIYRKSSLWETQ